MINIYVHCGINNTHITVVDFEAGCTIFNVSCGHVGRGALRSNRSVISDTVNLVVSRVLKYQQFCNSKGVVQYFVYFKGYSFSRSLVFSQLTKALVISNVYFVNKRIFNGCRSKKQRRLLFLMNVFFRFKSFSIR